MPGNISTSSLLSSAAARRNKIQEQEDSLVAFEYSLSAKTYDDFIAYSNYLSDRAKRNSDDTSKVLSYQKAIVGARKSYVSNEIQRQNISIVEGRGTNQSKYDTMVNLYYQALDNGDYDLAQNLTLQLDNLSVKIQQEEVAKQEAQQRAYGAMAKAGAKNLKQLVTKIQKGEELIELPDGRIIKPLAMLDKELKTMGDSSVKTGVKGQFFREAFDTATALRGILEDSYSSLSSQDDVDAFETRYGSILKGEKGFKIGGRDFDINELQLAYESAEMNNPIFTLKSSYNQSQGRTEFTLKENKVDNFAWVRRQDENGNDVYAPIPIRTAAEESIFGLGGPKKNLEARITNEGYVVGESGKPGVGKIGTGEEIKSDDSLTIGNRLRSLGIEAKNQDGKLFIQQPGDIEREAIIQPDGSIRYFGDNGELLEISLINKQGFYQSAIDPYTGQPRENGADLVAGVPRVVDPDEISDFGEESEFGGLISQASARGREYVRNYTTDSSGVSQVQPVDLRRDRLTGASAPILNARNTNISTANNFSGRGSPVLSTLLQGATFTQGNILKEKQAAIALQAQQEAALRLQQSQAFNLNQTPVAQWSQGGAPIRQLKVKPLPPARQIKVVPLPAAPRPRVTSGAGTVQGFGNINFSGPLRVR